jgi:lipoyl-dependent peroxiredoxin
VSLDAVDGIPTITTSQLKVRAHVDGLDAEAFAAVVDQAAALCPVSRLFAGAEISVDAELAETETPSHAR